MKIASIHVNQRIQHYRGIARFHGFDLTQQSINRSLRSVHGTAAEGRKNGRSRQSDPEIYRNLFLCGAYANEEAFTREVMSRLKDDGDL